MDVRKHGNPDWQTTTVGPTGDISKPATLPDAPKAKYAVHARIPNEFFS
jgi:hypothetical protein